MERYYVYVDAPHPIWIYQGRNKHHVQEALDMILRVLEHTGGTAVVYYSTHCAKGHINVIRGNHIEAPTTTRTLSGDLWLWQGHTI